MKFTTDFTYRNLHGFALFPGDSTALVSLGATSIGLLWVCSYILRLTVLSMLYVYGLVFIVLITVYYVYDSYKFF